MCNHYALPINVFLKNLQAVTFILPLLAVLSCFFTGVISAAEKQSTFGITNFAFSSYLGTGFYATSGQEVFVIQIPFQYTIREKTNTEAGWVLNLPLTDRKSVV